MAAGEAASGGGRGKRKGGEVRVSLNPRKRGEGGDRSRGRGRGRKQGRGRGEDAKEERLGRRESRKGSTKVRKKWKRAQSSFLPPLGRHLFFGWEGARRSSNGRLAGGDRGGFPSNWRKGFWLKAEVPAPFGFVWSSVDWYPESGLPIACPAPIPPKITVPHY